MNTDSPAGADPGALPDDPEQLRLEIERTREQLGETVEALVAKADVKARARERAELLSQRLKGTTAQARSQLAGKTADVKNAAVATGGPARDQLQARATAVGGAVRGKTPEPVQRAARQVAQRTSAVARQPAALAALAAAGVVVVGVIVIRQRRRR